MINIATNTKKV